jgi:hypothetical protein
LRGVTRPSPQPASKLPAISRTGDSFQNVATLISSVGEVEEGKCLLFGVAAARYTPIVYTSREKLPTGFPHRYYSRLYFNSVIRTDSTPLVRR